MKDNSCQFSIGTGSREDLSSGFMTRSDTNWAVLPQKMARDLKFRIKVTMQLICAFVFAYTESRFSHDAAQLQAGSMRSLNVIYRNEELTRKLLTPALQQLLVERIRDLWALLDLTESGPLLDSYLAELLELSAFVITELQNTDLLKVSAFILISFVEH